jgi:hypothetical protein
MKTIKISTTNHSSKIIKLLMPGFARACSMLCIGTITLLLTFLPITSSAQNGDPPPPPSEHGQNENQIPGGGAPIGDGLLMLLAMGTVYGFRKRVAGKKNEKEITE